MACSLCYESKDSLIDFESDEAKQLYIANILYKHFPFCFIVSKIYSTYVEFTFEILNRFILQEEPKYGQVCRKCWCKVDIFHQFFVRIEEIQGVCYRNEHIASNKCDTTSNDTKDLIISENIEFLESPHTPTDNFDNISVDDNYFEANSGNSSVKSTYLFFTILLTVMYKLFQMMMMTIIRNSNYLESSKRLTRNLKQKTLREPNESITKKENTADPSKKNDHNFNTFLNALYGLFFCSFQV